MSELKERFIKTLNLIDEDVVATPDACYFVAIGAAICDEAKLTSLKELTELSKTDLNVVTETKITVPHCFHLVMSMMLL